MTSREITYATRAYTKEEILKILNPHVAEWFDSKFDKLTPPQSYGVVPISEKKNVLISSPTGTGKTLTAFLSILSKLFDLAERNELKDKVYCIYVSPLRALNNDIYRNLEEPLMEIRNLIRSKGIELPEIRHVVRTGDTPPYEKQKMLRRPPHILITTPESLAIVLNAPKFRQKLKHVEYVIIDEIHSLAESKRGVHLTLSLERLQYYAETNFSRIGLSATINPLEKVAKFLVGYENDKPRQCIIVDTRYVKRKDIKVLCPVSDLIHTPSDVVNRKMYELLADLIRKHRTTLIFTNTRSGTERVVFHLKQLLSTKVGRIEEENVVAHHGSLSRNVRFEVEEMLKSGLLKAVVCVTPDSNVLSNPSWIEISRINAQKDIVYLDNQMRLRKGKFDGIFCGEYRNEGFRIRSRLGFEIKCTKEHKFLTIKDSKLKWIEARDLRVGDKVAVIRKIPTFQCRVPKYHELIPEKAYVYLKKEAVKAIKDEIRLKFSTIKHFCKLFNLNYSKIGRNLSGRTPFVFGDLLKILKRLNKEELLEKIEIITTDKKKNYLINKKVSKEFFRFLGFYLAEGSWDTSGISITGEEYLLEYYSKMLTKDFRITPTKTMTRHGVPVFKFSSLLLRSIIEKLFYELRGKSLAGEFLSIIYELPDEYKWEFLSGYFDGKGYVEIKNGRAYSINLVTFNKKYADSIQTLLLQLGVIASKKRREFNDRLKFRKKEIKMKGTCYTISIYGDVHLRKFAKFIRPQQKKLKLAIRRILETEGYCNRDVILNINNLLKKVREKTQLSTYRLQKVEYNPEKVEVEKRDIKRSNQQKLTNIYKKSQIEGNLLEVLADSDIFWDEVVEKEPIYIDKIYSLVNTPNHNYIIEGFICQNSSTSLELGIDIGYIDLVVQIGSPKSVTRCLQRIGRSGHRMHEVSKGRLICVDRDDIVECSVMVREAYRGHLDKIHIPKNALDVLAQHILGMAIEKKWTVDEAYSLVKRSYCYRDLTKKDFLNVLKYLSGNYSILEHYRVYGKIWFDPENEVFGRRGKYARVIYALNIGTIPDEVSVKVFTTKGKYVGNIEEEFLERLVPGDRFILGGKVYEYIRSRAFKAYVKPAFDMKPTVPSWFSEMLPLSFDLALKIGEFRRRMFLWLEANKPKEAIIKYIRRYCHTDYNSAKSILEYFNEEYLYLKYLGVKAFPSDKIILIENYLSDDGKIYQVYHTLYGRRVNDALSRALGYLASKKARRNIGIVVHDNGFALVYPRGIKPRINLASIKSCELKALLAEAIRNTEMFKRRFRHVAARGLMILRNYKGHEISVNKQQLNANTLLKIVEELEDFPLLKETYREIMEDVMDVENAEKVLRWIEKGKVKVVEIPIQTIPSPFAYNIVLEGLSDVVLMEDKRALIERFHEIIMEKIANLAS
ncbi:MAG: DEAD/DEAH box helicase [Thermoproteales archaeon]|nr:DEAD/DEAH box helicase [Thermoproteales archaeon]